MDLFLEYWGTHASTSSGETAIKDYVILGTFTSNNSESKNAGDSINQATEAARAKPWVDYTINHLSTVRSYINTNRQLVDREIRQHGQHGISQYAAEQIASNANAGNRCVCVKITLFLRYNFIVIASTFVSSRQFILISLHPEETKKKFSVSGKRESSVRRAVKEILIGYVYCLHQLFLFL